MNEEHLYKQPGKFPPKLYFYAKKVADYRYWQGLSAHLFYVANKIEPEVKDFWNRKINAIESPSSITRQEEERDLQFHDTYLMLVGLAIENLLKAIIVKKNTRDLFEQTLNEQKLPSVLNSHDLESLRKNAKINLSKEYMDFLKRLKHLVLWAGRYPVPLKPEPENRPFSQERVATSHTREYSSKDIMDIAPLVEVISKQASIRNPLTQGVVA